MSLLYLIVLGPDLLPSGPSAPGDFPTGARWLHHEHSGKNELAVLAWALALKISVST